jgi:hypothetical protein
LLNRPVDPSGLAFWTGLLAQGLGRNQVVGLIEASGEYRTDQVEGLYAHLLHRSADAGGLNAFVTFLGAGGTMEQAATLIAGSTEYFQNRGGGTSDGFLDALYQDALNRQVDAAGRAIFDQALAGGASPSEVAAAIFGSGEYLQDLVQGFYGHFLHRPADAGGLNGFAGALSQGARDQDVIAAILASGEYGNRL